MNSEDDVSMAFPHALTDEQMTGLFKSATDRQGAVKALARRLNMGASSLYEMRGGRQNVTPVVANELGYKKMWVKVK